MAQAVSALFYLWSRTLVNVLVGRLRRLRQPKYLIGAVLAVAYLYLVFVSPNLSLRERAETEFTPPLDLPAFVTAMLAAGMLVLFAITWLWRRDRSSLHFSEAEIAYFFPGPISHAALVHYGLIRGQVALLLTALFLALISAGWQFLPSPLWVRFLGWWLIMAVFTLHITAAGFVMTRMQDRGMAQWQRQLLVAAVLVLVFGVMVRFDPHLRLPSPLETRPPSAFAAYLQNQIGSGPLYWLLLPLRAVAKPLVAADALAFAQALLPALLVYALHYYWAFKSEVPDADATLARAEKRAGMLAALRKGTYRFGADPAKARPDPFTLAAQGSPVAAFLWKNLLSTREYLNLRTALILVVGMFALDYWVESHREYLIVNAVLVPLALLLGVQTLLVGAQFARQDLRNDLENADVIKTYPLEGWQIVMGELLAPGVILTGILWLCLLQVVLGAEAPRLAWLTPQLRVVTGLSLAVVLPFLCTVQLLLANATAVLFPAWTKATGMQAGQGLEVAGQRLLFFAAQWLAMMAALLPGLLFGLLVYLPAQRFIGFYAVLPASLMAAVVLAGELAWGINWLGERFEAYDLSA